MSIDFLSRFYTFGGVPVTVYFAHIASRHEMVEFLLLKIIEELGILVLCQQGDVFYFFFSRIASLEVVKRTSTMELIDYVLLDFLMVLADNADALAFVKAVFYDILL